MPPLVLKVSLRDGKFQADVLRAGQGDPLLSRHGSAGQKG